MPNTCMTCSQTAIAHVHGLWLQNISTADKTEVRPQYASAVVHTQKHKAHNVSSGNPQMQWHMPLKHKYKDESIAASMIWITHGLVSRTDKPRTYKCNKGCQRNHQHRRIKLRHLWKSYWKQSTWHTMKPFWLPYRYVPPRGTRGRSCAHTAQHLAALQVKNAILQQAKFNKPATGMLCQ